VEPTLPSQPVPRRPLPVLSWTLCVVCLLVFLRHAGAEVPDRLLLDGRAIAGGEWWRALLSSVEHLTPWHLLLNLALLFWFGPVVEEQVGSARLLVATVITVVAGSALALTLTFWFRGAGASTILAGWLGLALPIGSPRRRRVLLQWALFLVLVSLVPGSSPAAHVGSFLCGLLLGLLIRAGSLHHPEARFHWFDRFAPALAALAAGAVWLAVRLHASLPPVTLPA
jgi:membrane associated rhomboid family serine protease